MKKIENRNGVKFEDFIENDLWKCRVSCGINSFVFNNSFDFFAASNNIDEFSIKDFSRFIEVKEEKIKVEDNSLKDVLEDLIETLQENTPELDLIDDDKKLLDLQNDLENSNKRLETHKGYDESLYKREKKTNSNLKRKITILKKKMDK